MNLVMLVATYVDGADPTMEVLFDSRRELEVV